MAGIAYKDLSEYLRLFLRPLEYLRIPVKTWTTTELARHFITKESFIINIEAVIRMDKKIVPTNEMSLALQRGFWTHNSKCTPTTMMKFCNYRRQIVLLEKEMEEKIGEVERCYLPASQYVPLTEQELLKRCYKMYVDEGAESEKKVKELNQELIEFIKSKYEEEVRLLHMGNFTVDEKRKRLLKFWTNERDKTIGISY